MTKSPREEPIRMRDVTELKRGLARMHEQSRERGPQPEPGEQLAELRPGTSPYEAAQRLFEAREQRMDEREQWAAALAQELLPPLAPGHGELEPLLRALQQQVLQHPTAFRAGFAALAAEGRRFAETPEGAAWQQRLAQSPLLPQARLLLKMLSLSMLDEREPERLPSAYVEGLLRAAAAEHGDSILSRLFGADPDVG